MTSALDVKIRALVEGLDDILRLRTGLGGVGEGADDAGDGLSKLQSPLGYLKDNIGSLIGAFTALAAAYGIKESVDYAARTETLGATLGVVAKNAGYSGAEISKYEKELKASGITIQVAREAMTQMIQAGLPLGPMAEGGASSISKLARAAQDLAVVTGENSSATLQRLITNIAQMDTVGLRYMGLTVNIEAAQQKFALSIGKTADQLTQQQKTQAVLNEAMAQADKLSGAYATSMEMVGKKAQSLKRYQEELANTVGTHLLPSYGALIDVVTEFLKAAEATISQVDKNGDAARHMADGVKDFFDAVSDVLLEITNIGAEVYPVLATVGSQILSLTGELLRGAAAVATFGGSVDTAGGKVSALGQTLNVVVAAVGYLVAAVRDGMSMIVVTLQAGIGLTSAALGLLVVGIGKVISLFDKDLGASIAAAGRELIGFGNHLGDVATETVDAFGRGDSSLGKFNRSLGESAQLTKALAAASTYDEIEEQIRKLLEAKRENTKTDVELKDSTDQVSARLKQLGVEGKLTTQELAKLEIQLGKVGSDSRDQFTKALDDIGLSLQKIDNTDHLLPLNKELGKVTAGLTALAENAGTTVDLFQQAFAKGLNTAKTVGDIDAISVSLKEAEKRGWDLGEANQNLVARFEEVFTASLKAAKTSADYKLLEDQVRAVGNSGRVAGDLITLALDQIADKARGAGDELERVGKRATEAAQSALSVARAHLALVQADADVGRARIGVWQAQNKYARDGSDLSRESLRLAQLNLTLAQAKAEQARLYHFQEQQANNVLIAQQELINAKKREGLDVGNAALVAASAAAQKEVEGAQAVFETTKQKVIAQQEAVLAIEEQVIRQKLLVDQTRATADEARSVAGHIGTAAENTRAAAGHAGSLSGQLSAAADAAKTLAGNVNEGANALMRQATALDGVRAAQQRLDAAQGNGSGVMTLGTGKDQSKGSDSGSVKDRSNGLRPGYTISAEQNAMRDFLDTGKALPESARAYIAANLRAQEANLQQMQQSRAYFSLDGQSGMMAQYNEARRAAESMGITSGQSAGLRGLGDSGSGGFAAMSNQLLDQIKTSSPVSIPSGTVQSISSQSPSKTIQVNFTNDSGQSVPVTVDAANEGALLALLQKAKGVSA